MSKITYPICYTPVASFYVHNMFLPGLCVSQALQYQIWEFNRSHATMLINNQLERTGQALISILLFRLPALHLLLARRKFNVFFRLRGRVHTVVSCNTKVLSALHQCSHYWDLQAAATHGSSRCTLPTSRTSRDAGLLSDLSYLSWEKRCWHCLCYLTYRGACQNLLWHVYWFRLVVPELYLEDWKGS